MDVSLAVFRATVVFSITAATVLLAMKMPPPFASVSSPTAWLRAISERVIVSVPRLQMPPPTSPVLSRIALSLMFTSLSNGL